ncbi:MAG: hemolysin family protein [Desulfobacteraceae bacterium]|nr:hemolysin family protein [Desulfobacteraceae bacterium]
MAISTQFLILFVLLILSGFFSSAETALFSISRTKARHLAKSDSKALQLIHRLKRDPHKLLSTILVGNNVVNVGASAMATSLALEAFPHFAVGLSTGVMTLLILVFGEVIPKSLATRNNVAIAKLIIFPIYYCSILFFPVLLFLNFIPKLTGKIQQTPSLTEEELKTFVEVVEEEGEIKEEEMELIHNIFELDDTSASEIMTPRTDMFVIDAGKPLDIEEILKSGYSRIPVMDGDFDHIIGVVNIKDLFHHFVTTGSQTDPRAVMSPPYFVPGNKKLDTLVKQFRTRKNHMAIVVDEHGGVSGLITFEDALEELVGEISDETDIEEEPQIQKKGENEWIVFGKTEIETVNESLPLNIPDAESYDTFSGYILDVIGRIPREKEEIKIGSFTITVLEKEGNRLNKFQVKKLDVEQHKEAEASEREVAPA